MDRVGTVVVAVCEKKRGLVMADRQVCALDGCEETFVPPPQAPHKPYCSERHQRIAEKRRFRERHTEEATCKRKRCGETFERTTTSQRMRVYCSLKCQRLDRSAQYSWRPDILAGMAKARAAKAPTS